MPDYRRLYIPGGTYFFTVVTYQRRPFLTEDLSRAALRKSIVNVQHALPFTLDAIVLLPDHLHCVWTLPTGDADFSGRWRKIKEQFTRQVGAQWTGPTQIPSRQRHRERDIWQRRFWEHLCRDEDDAKRCIDYVHWNPVKHGLVERVRDYPWSSFHRYVAAGEYSLDWGQADSSPGFAGAEWE